MLSCVFWVLWQRFHCFLHPSRFSFGESTISKNVFLRLCFGYFWPFLRELINSHPMWADSMGPCCKDNLGNMIWFLSIVPFFMFSYLQSLLLQPATWLVVDQIRFSQLFSFYINIIHLKSKLIYSSGLIFS